MAFQSLVLVNVAVFNGKADKNGEQPILLNVLAGKAPNRNVISGTVAKRNNFVVGKMYIVQITEGKEDATYGRQFNHNIISEVAVTEMFGAIQGLGQPAIFNVEGTSSAPTAETSEAIETIFSDEAKA